MSEYPQVVYFVQQGEGGPIKIGTTTFAVLDGRLKQLQIASPYPLRLLGVVTGGHDVERRIHERFSTCRLEGEWFGAERDLIEFITANVRQPSELEANSAFQVEGSSTAASEDRLDGVARAIMPRSLSPVESKLILHMESEKQRVMTIVQAMAILNSSHDHARQVLHRLVRRRWLARLTRGRYELIPAALGECALLDTNPFFAGSTLVEPYYFSFATAAFFHGLSTQASATVYLATSMRTRRRLYEVRGREYRLVLQPPHKFFGAVEVDAYGSIVNMAGPEKTVVDALDRPEYAGDLPEVAGMLWRGKSHLDWDKLAEYGLRFESQALIQRLGYLADVLELPVPARVRDRLLAGVGKSTPYLGRAGRWGTGGEYNARWQIVANIPRAELLSEIEIV